MTSEWGVAQGSPPSLSRVGARVKTVWSLGGEYGACMTQIVSTGTSGMGKKPQEYEGTATPTPSSTGENSCSGCLDLWTVGAWPLNSPAVHGP